MGMGRHLHSRCPALQISAWHHSKVCSRASTHVLFRHRKMRCSMKILLFDDDTTLLDVTAFALRRAGFLVVLAHDAEQALQVWSAEQPDLIILDIQLPGKDGLTL